MGKRNSRKHNQKKLEFIIEEVPFVFNSSLNILTSHLCKLEDEKKLLDLECLQDQIKHYISRIYSEFALDLEERRANRLQSKNFFEEKPPPNLSINADFMNKMKELLFKIQDEESILTIKNFVYKQAESFVDQLKVGFCGMVNAKRQFQIILMHEAYGYIANISKEITLLLSSILKHDEKNIKKHHKKMFYQKIMRYRSDLIEYIAFSKSPTFSETQIYKKYKKFEKNERVEFRGQQELCHKCRVCIHNQKRASILIVARSDKISSVPSLLPLDISSQPQTCVDKISSEPVHFLSIDQVVDYIEGNTKQNKRQTKKIKNPTAFRENNALDREIHEFEIKLNLMPPASKLKLVLPDYFLQDLRDKIKECREKLKLDSPNKTIH